MPGIRSDGLVRTTERHACSFTLNHEREASADGKLIPTALVQLVGTLPTGSCAVVYGVQTHGSAGAQIVLRS